MIDIRAVRRYTRALFELGAGAGLLNELDDQLLAVRRLVEAHPPVIRVFSNSTITFAEKEDFLKKILPAETLPLLINFLKVLIKKNRFYELFSIQEEFHRYYERKHRVEEVIAISAVALSETNTAKLRNVLEKRLNSDISLVVKTDPEMIGGLILRFGGHEINASFRSRLDSLHQLLTA